MKSIKFLTSIYCFHFLLHNYAQSQFKKVRCMCLHVGEAHFLNNLGSKIGENAIPPDPKLIISQLMA